MSEKREISISKGQAGFSLLELMVAASIFLVVAGSIYGLLEVGRLDRNRSSRKSDTSKNARASMHLLGRDILNAGFGYNKVGGVATDNFVSNLVRLPADNDLERDFLKGIIVGNNINANALLTEPNAKTDVISIVYRDVEFNNGDKIDLVSAQASPTAAGTIRIVTEPGDAANIRVHDLFLIESASSQVVAMVTSVNAGSNYVEFAPGDPLGLNQPLTGSGHDASLLRPCVNTSDEHCTTYLASMKKLIWSSYRVGNDGTLLRSFYANNTGASPTEQVRTQPLAYGVKDMQIQYVLEDGSVSDDPEAGPDGIRGNSDDSQALLELIRQVTVTLTVRSVENDEQTGSEEVIKITSTYSTRNMRYTSG